MIYVKQFEKYFISIGFFLLASNKKDIKLSN